MKKTNQKRRQDHLGASTSIYLLLLAVVAAILGSAWPAYALDPVYDK